MPALGLTSNSVKQLEHLLDASLRPRILNIPDPPQRGMPAGLNSKLAILFSGGLDCTVLARMAHEILPLDQPIDLLNVAFENPRVVAAAKQAPKVKGQRKARQGKRGQAEGLDEIAKEPVVAEVASPEEINPFELCPDRITGRASARELRSVCSPGRTWRFVEVTTSEPTGLLS